MLDKTSGVCDTFLCCIEKLSIVNIAEKDVIVCVEDLNADIAFGEHTIVEAIMSDASVEECDFVLNTGV